MKKESAASLFFSMFLKAIVIILGLIIIIFGIVFLVKVVKHDDGEKAPATTVNENILTEAGKHDDLLYNTGDDEDTEDDTTQDVAGDDTTNSFGYSIIVLNSTDYAGLAGRWADKLTGYGYTVSEKADYFNTLTSTKIISTKEGVGEDLVQYFKSASYEVGQLTEGSNVSLSGYDIIVIIGEDDYDGQ